MPMIEPHIHMFSRTTDDYQAMYRAGIRACVEPSFWLGANRRYPGSFFDYFQLILEFETVRARRFGIDHYAAVSLNPKEAENVALADAVLDGLDPYLDHPRCVAVGEIGFNHITEAEAAAFRRQLEMAAARELPAIVHLPHVNKPEGMRRTAAIIREVGIAPERVLIDHHTEDTIAEGLATGCYCGMTVYPISKLTPERVSAMVRTHGATRVMVNGSADWGVSDPLSLIKVLECLRRDGHAAQTLHALTYANAMAFYGASPKWQPVFDLAPLDPREFQR